MTTVYLEQGGLSWKKCVSVCTDGAAAMMGSAKGFINRVRAQNVNVRCTHCFLHREALVAKTLPKELSDVLDSAEDIVNFIKARPELPVFDSIQGNGSRTLLVATHGRPLAFTGEGFRQTVRVKRRTQNVPDGRQFCICGVDCMTF